MAPERFTESRQRQALHDLAATTDFLRSEEGRLFLDQIRCYLVPGILARASRVGIGSGWVGTEEVVHTAVLGLCDSAGRVARYASEAAGEPWGYLFRCLMTWMSEQWGSRGISFDEALIGQPAPSAEMPVHLTPLAEVIAATFAILEVHTPERLRTSVRQLLVWVANNPPQRLSHEAEDRAAARIRFPELTQQQISAVVNAAWGGRPTRSDTSLMAAFLLDENFCPYDSPAHSRVILRYKTAFRETTPSRSQLHLDLRTA